MKDERVAPTPQHVAGWHDTLADAILEYLVPDETMPTSVLPYFEDWLQDQARMHRRLAAFCRTL